MTGTRVHPRSSYNFPLPIVSLFNPILEKISRPISDRNMFQNYVESASDVSREAQMSYHNDFPFRRSYYLFFDFLPIFS